MNSKEAIEERACAVGYLRQLKRESIKCRDEATRPDQKTYFNTRAQAFEDAAAEITQLEHRDVPPGGWTLK